MTDEERKQLIAALCENPSTDDILMAVNQIEKDGSRIKYLEGYSARLDAIVAEQEEIFNKPEPKPEPEEIDNLSIRCDIYEKRIEFLEHVLEFLADNDKIDIGVREVAQAAVW